AGAPESPLLLQLDALRGERFAVGERAGEDEIGHRTRLSALKDPKEAGVEVALVELPATERALEPNTPFQSVDQRSHRNLGEVIQRDEVVRTGQLHEYGARDRLH